MVNTSLGVVFKQQIQLFGWIYLKRMWQFHNLGIGYSLKQRGLVGIRQGRLSRLFRFKFRRLICLNSDNIYICDFVL